MNAAPDQLLSEQQLDALLRGVFIRQAATDETVVSENTIQAAAVIFAGQPGSVVTAGTDRLFRKRLGIKQRPPRFLLNTLIVIVAGMTVFASWWILRDRETKSTGWNHSTKGTHKAAIAASTPETETDATDTPAENAPETPVYTSTADSAVITDSTITHRAVAAPVEREGYNPSRRPEQYSYADKDVPVLSPQEIAENNKLKLSMLRGLARKEGIIKVAPDAVVRGSEVLATGLFEMKALEVTNQEYLVFLNDLVINGLYEEYHKANVDAAGWQKAGQTGMDTKYMKPGYKKFPVVNISREGAMLFCAWLTRSFDDAVQQKEVKWSETRLRLRFELPLDIEWLRAARGKNRDAIYPWGKNTVQNTSGCFLANFSYIKSKEQLVPGASQCISKTDKATNAVSTAGHSIDSLVTCPVDSYNPNDFGFYCMSGNAAEMVWKWDRDMGTKPQVPLAMGGSWNSSCDNVRIDAVENYEDVTTPSAEIGFRYVIRTVSKPLLEKVTYKTASGENRETEIPVIGELMRKQVEKSKKEMAENVLNHKGYSFIPMGSYNRNGTTVSLHAFYMQQQEVSNMEYRTFLYDLVLQKRFEEFDRANVCSTCWSDEWKYSYNRPMDEHYFTHPAYDNYPVVNIPREGAKLYCAWLSKTTNDEQVRKGKPTGHLNDARLPSDIEWEYAAHAGSDTSIYPWNGVHMRNAKGQFLANYYEIKTDSAGKTTNDLLSDGAFHTASRSSYGPNAWGLYNMAGNVSEMVEKMRPDQTMKYIPAGPAAKGGNWFSVAKNLRIQSEEEYEGVVRPTPQIGFRVVMTYTAPPK